MHTLANYQTQLKFALVAAVIVISGCSNGNGNSAIGGELENPEPPTTGAFQLVWSEEFDGSSLDAANWDVQEGDGSAETGVPGWGNNEQQYYTADNISLESGNLVIEARAGDSPDPDYDYTSGRISSEGKLDITYGRIEASIQVPPGVGLWAAFWTLGSDPSVYGPWAAKGEIDIMESFGGDTPFVQGAAHYGMEVPQGIFAEKRNETIDPTDGFHQYAIEWDAAQIRWYVDGEHYYTLRNETYWNYYYAGMMEGFRQGGPSAPFDEDQHIILNMAVGGNLPGDPTDPSVFPARMLIDYVRVYECEVDPTLGLGCFNSIDEVDPFLIAEVPEDDVFTVSYGLYQDGLQTLFEGTGSDRALDIDVFDNDGALVVTEVTAPDGETVLDLRTTGGGNVSITDGVGAPFTLLGMGTGEPDSGTYGGEIKFEMRVISGADTDPSGSLRVKMDSGFPDVGFLEIPLSELPQDEFGLVSLRISDILQSNQGADGGGVPDIANLVNLVTFEPTSAAHLQIGNVRLKCGAPESCGIEAIATTPLNVFIDEVGPAWGRGIRAFDTLVGTDYDQSSGNHVSWTLPDTGEAGQDTVIEATFDDNGASGLIFIGAPEDEFIDISGYAGGELVFDIRFLSNPNDLPLFYKVDGRPDEGTGEQSLGVLPLNSWETFNIPVSKLQQDGLVLTEVTAFVLLPTFAGQDAVFQIDNVRFEPTLSPPTGAEGATGCDLCTDFDDPSATYVFEDFGDPVTAMTMLAMDPLDSNNMVAMTTKPLGAPLWAGTTLNEGQLVYPLTTSASQITVRVYSPDAGVPVRLKIEDAADPTRSVETEATTTTAGAWETLTFDFNNQVDGTAALDPSYTYDKLSIFFNFGTDGDTAGEKTYLWDTIEWIGDSVPPVPGISYNTDFESADPAGSLIGDGWTTFVNVFDGGGNFLYNYGTFPSPNGTGAISSIETGEGGPAQGVQYLNSFSDYNNADHGVGYLIDVSNFQEFTIGAEDGGNYRLTFDAKAPSSGGIAPPSTATAFIKTIDPASGFITTNEVTLDLSSVSNTDWATYSLDLAIDAVALDGQLLQFGFTNQATNFDPSGIYFDNVSFGIVEVAGISYSSDFESADASAPEIGDGWTTFVNVFDGGGNFLYNYGTFPSPNNTGAISSIETGEGGAEQGAQYLNSFSDYNNADHGVGNLINVSNFQERPITSGDGGDYRLTFDAKAPAAGGIAPPSTATAFIKTIDPASGFITTSEVVLDMSGVSSTDWATFTVDLTIDGAALAGQLLQFGFTNTATNFDPSGIYFDNVVFGLAGSPPPVSEITYSADFEAADPAGTEIGDGWTSFVNVFDGGGNFLYNYGTFPSPNNTGAISSIETGEGGAGQGAQYLNAFSDYNNADHGVGNLINVSTFQERTIAAGESGDYRLTFDAKAPAAGGIAAPSTATAFIKIIDPASGFSTTVEVVLDMSGVSSTDWVTFSVDLTIDATAVAGQLLQFGFTNTATNFDPSGIYYDNVDFGFADATPPPPPPPAGGGDGLPGDEGATGGAFSTSFEEGTTVFEDFGDPVTAMTMLVSDPTSASNMVAMTVKPLGAPLWAGTTANEGQITYPLTTTDSVITVRVYSPDAGIPVRLKLEDAADPTRTVETEAVTTSFDGWETLSFDFNNPADGTAALNPAYTFNKMSIFFNFGTDGDTAGEKTYFWDTIEFETSAPPPPPPPPAGGISYSADFEASDAMAGEIGDGWTTFVNVFDGGGGFVYGYGTFASPNGTGNISAIDSGEGGVDQGTQYLTVLSDYNNADHGTGLTINPLTFQERTIAAGDGGTYSLSFDAKAPTSGGTAAPSTAYAFIKVLDLLGGSFAELAIATVDLTGLSSADWAAYSVELAVDAGALEGQLLQFGFSNSSTNFDPSAVSVDNVDFGIVGAAPPPPPPPPPSGGDGLPGNEGATGGLFSTSFEEGTTTLEDFGDPVTAMSMLTSDPTSASNTVVMTVKPLGTPLWAGTTVNEGQITYPLDNTDSVITVRVYSPDAGIPVRLKVEDAADPTRSVETEAVTTSSGGWETLSFDFNNEAPGTAALNPAYTFNKMSIFFNFGTDGDTAGEKTYYWDTIEFEVTP